MLHESIQRPLQLMLEMKPPLVGWLEFGAALGIFFAVACRPDAPANQGAVEDGVGRRRLPRCL
jgi:hypothetical protein